MTFPGAGAQIYRNEAGEPIGWDEGYLSYPDTDERDYEEEEYWRNGGDQDEEQDEPEDPNEQAAQFVAAMEARGLKVRHYGEDTVINVTTPGRGMTPADVEMIRTALTEHNYAEVESWIAAQGASWLSDGVFAGVSFRVRPA